LVVEVLLLVLVDVWRVGLGRLRHRLLAVPAGGAAGRCAAAGRFLVL
jgi:hypothetical protein